MDGTIRKITDLKTTVENFGCVNLSITSQRCKSGAETQNRIFDNHLVLHFQHLSIAKETNKQCIWDNANLQCLRLNDAKMMRFYAVFIIFVTCGRGELSFVILYKHADAKAS